MTLTRRSATLLAGSSVMAARSLWSATRGNTMTTSIQSQANSYIDAWARKDLNAIEAHLHPQVHFKGPMQELQGRDAVLAATKQIFPLLQRMDIRARFVDGARAMFAYDFVCGEPIGVCRTAELVQFDGTLIRDIELYFDARPFEAMQRAQAAGGK